MMKWKKLKPNQFKGTNLLAFMWCVCVAVLSLCFIWWRQRLALVGIVAMLGIGVLYITTIQRKCKKMKKMSRLIENFIRKNKLYQSHYVIEENLFRQKEVERMDYYPFVEYREVEKDNIFCIRIRLDGTLTAEKFRDMEQALSDMFCSICVDKIEERGYLTYCFELHEQKQVTIETWRDIVCTEESEIVFSSDIVWNWKKTPHLLLTGNTGSGKTQLAQYIISCLLKQGVRVIYCDPKNDDDMRLFLKNKPVTYAIKENEIAKVVREAEEEVRLREKDLTEIGIEEAEFNPVFLIFDELIAFSKIAEKKAYEETAKRLSTIVVTGRSKRVYVGLILQRPDTVFVEGAVRENLSCKICMGQMSETAYKMSFGSDFASIKNYRHEVGAGLIYRQGIDTKPREFIAPFICKGALSRME